MNVLNLLKETNALLQGHFVLSSGLHSAKYIQCASVLKYPKYAEKLCKELAKKFKGVKVDAVIAPAIGGILVSYELARALGVPSLFTERKDGQMLLRRNFKIAKGERLLVVEDVITTGGSTKEVIDVVNSCGGEVVGVGCIIDRCGKKNIFGKIPLKSLQKITVVTYPPDKCPLCKQGIPVDKPGSKQK
ncbi:MAG: orotate phosphoribosyltransferase [Candidatus Omnitrophota bacterium]